MQKHPGKLVHCIVEKRDGHFPLAAVPYKDIAALVSDVESGAWEGVGAEKLNKWFRWFQEVNIDILKDYEMIPFRFGVMVDDEQIIQNFLVGAYLPIKSAFDKIRGRLEYQVQVGCDLKAMLRKIAAERKIAVGETPGLDRLKAIEIGQALFQAAQAEKKALTEAVHRKLASVSVDSSEGRCADESTIMNLSYLVEKKKEPVFEQAMEKLGQENEAYLVFRYFGPLPPYSFVPLKFDRANYHLIQQARKVLQLGPRASINQIKASYRKLALKFHPDRNPGCLEAETCFKKVAGAYTILNAYCRSLLGSAELQADTPCSFAREDVERVFIVRDKV